MPSERAILRIASMPLLYWCAFGADGRGPCTIIRCVTMSTGTCRALLYSATRVCRTVAAASCIVSRGGGNAEALQRPSRRDDRGLHGSRSHVALLALSRTC
jgi:hypothetical protein